MSLLISNYLIIFIILINMSKTLTAHHLPMTFNQSPAKPNTADQGYLSSGSAGTGGPPGSGQDWRLRMSKEIHKRAIQKD